MLCLWPQRIGFATTQLSIQEVASRSSRPSIEEMDDGDIHRATTHQKMLALKSQLGATPRPSDGSFDEAAVAAAVSALSWGSGDSVASPTGRWRKVCQHSHASCPLRLFDWK